MAPLPKPLPKSKPIPKSRPKSSPATSTKITPYQSRVYSLLSQIPPGRLTTYGALARVLNSSPRAVGGACRRNPFAPEIPCHRVISSNGYVAGYKGDWEDAPSGINQSMKLELLREEGVEFNGEGVLIERGGVWFDGPWVVPG